MLIFNQQSRPEANDLLKILGLTLETELNVRFEHVLFCTNVTTTIGGYRKGALRAYTFPDGAAADGPEDFLDRNSDPVKVARYVLSTCSFMGSIMTYTCQ